MTEKSPHWISLTRADPVFQSDLGSIQVLDVASFPMLSRLSIKRLTLAPGAIREPQWNVNANQLAYVVRGQALVSMLAGGHARMRVLDPDTVLDEYVLSPGDAYFVPRAYPHHIEVIGDDEFHFLIFFDQPTPGDIGYRATASAFSRDVLASTFGIPEPVLPAFPFTPVDPLIVPRPNPADPVS